MPKPLRYLIATTCIVVGLVPLGIAPGLAESYGWDRETGSHIGAWISITWFVVGGRISLKIIRRRERHQIGVEVNELLAPYRDDDGERDES